jgi:hypothetical protein
MFEGFAFIIAQATTTTPAAGVPDPTYKQPPGSAGLLTILSWAGWIVAGICVLGILVCAGKMAFAGRRGEGGEHMQSLGWTMGACVLAGSASAVVTALI